MTTRTHATAQLIGSRTAPVEESPMPNYQPAVGDHVRVIRFRPDGRRHFNKTGTIRSIDRHDYWGYGFDDDETGFVRLASNAQMKLDGWAQTIELA